MENWKLRNWEIRTLSVWHSIYTFSLFCSILFFSNNTLFAQYNQKRDAVKVGYAQARISSESVFVPSVYLEYTRLFVHPITIGIMGHYAHASGIVTDTEDRTLNTFSLDFNGYYALINNDYNNLQLGVGFSGRIFKTDWIVRATDTEPAFGGSDNNFRPGFSLVANYDYNFKQLFLGLRGSFHTYSNAGSIILIGGHLGFRF